MLHHYDQGCKLSFSQAHSYPKIWPKIICSCAQEMLDSCMQRNYKARPAMSEITSLLEGLLKLVDDGEDLSLIQWKMSQDKSVMQAYNSMSLDSVWSSA